MTRLLTIVPVIFFWGVFIYIVFQVPYPQSLIQANAYRIFPFFISLLIAIGFTLNILIKNIFISFSISLGLIFILILKALDMINLATIALTLISIGLLISYFRKIKRSNLTKLPKIPKLTRLRKEI